jgi:hypothetical protein
MIIGLGVFALAKASRARKLVPKVTGFFGVITIPAESFPLEAVTSWLHLSPLTLTRVEAASAVLAEPHTYGLTATALVEEPPPEVFALADAPLVRANAARAATKSLRVNIVNVFLWCNA